MSGSRTLKLSILADVDDLKKKLDDGSKEVEGFGGKLEKFGKVAAAAFAAAAVAAAAYAGKLAIEGVKAAIEDEAAQNRLANALKNVTGATDAQIASVEKQISKLSFATGIADDQLRPAFQRLATATGSLETANKALNLALDISAATGRSVEQVSNALGKAYEGNTGALAKLGVGLSTAEIKSMGLDATMNQLSKTFGGAASTQANTLEGQIARLKVTFDETKESVGAALLPTLQRLLDYFINTVIPKFIEFKDKAIKPVTDAIENNKESLTLLYNFIRQYIIPILIDGFGNALQFIGKIAGGIINVISAVVDGIKSAVEFAINAINTLIRAYNAIPFLPNVNTIQAPSVSAAPKVTAPSVPSISATSISTGVTTAPSVSSSGVASKSPVSQTLIEQVTASNALKNMTPGAFDPSAVRRGDERGNINITVNGAVDPASTARQIANILNSEAAQSGSFTDLGISRFATRVD
ncbi:MAG: hypothetical protein EB015_05970 [Methylocystaceae bacterium]|nr:hypothetical protein [Methylocystaceae bacterium]